MKRKNERKGLSGIGHDKIERTDRKGKRCVLSQSFLLLF
jgi:hypothetical protein